MPQLTQDPAARLAEAIRSRTATICVVGMGYVGLPLARVVSAAGFEVVGFDTDGAKVEALEAGRSYIAQIPNEAVAALKATGRFRATTATTAFDEADAILICVPTPLTDARDPDLSYVIGTGESIARHLRAGQLVVLESTTYPGTTEEVLKPILERGGLRAERDFFLAFSPEREDPGNPAFHTGNIPKIVGGVGPRSADLAEALYGAAVERVVRVGDTRVAEAAKLLENTYRAVNIALVNELKVLLHRMGINISEVIEAASTKPFGFQPFYPGPGLGGHCIPIDPFYLTWLARRHGLDTQFIELAGRVNTGMPRYVVDRVISALNDQGKPLRGSKVLVLGLAYKKDIDDTRESPAFPIIDDLVAGGAEVTYNDPFVPTFPEKRAPHAEVPSVPLTAETLEAQDCVVLVTDHSRYDLRLILDHTACLVDTRDAVRGLPHEGVVYPA